MWLRCAIIGIFCTMRMQFICQFCSPVCQLVLVCGFSTVTEIASQVEPVCCKRNAAPHSCAHCAPLLLFRWSCLSTRETLCSRFLWGCVRRTAQRTQTFSRSMQKPCSLAAFWGGWLGSPLAAACSSSITMQRKIWCWIHAAQRFAHGQAMKISVQIAEWACTCTRNLELAMPSCVA